MNSSPTRGTREKEFFCLILSRGTIKNTCSLRRNNEERLLCCSLDHTYIAGIISADVARFCVPRTRSKDTVEEHKRTGSTAILRSRNTEEHKDMKHLLVGIGDTFFERTPEKRTAGAISILNRKIPHISERPVSIHVR